MNTTCVHLSSVLNPGEVKDVRQTVQRLDEGGDPGSSSQLVAVDAGPRPLGSLVTQWMNTSSAGAELSLRHAVESVRARVESLMGTAPILLQEFLMKLGPEQRGFPWHQDAPFWPVEPGRGLVTWIALDACEAESGAIQVGARPETAADRVDLHTGRYLGAGVEPDPGPITGGYRFEPGDGLAFGGAVWHRSSPRAAGQLRRAWALTWLADGTRWRRSRAPRHPRVASAVDGSPVADLLVQQAEQP